MAVFKKILQAHPREWNESEHPRDEKGRFAEKGKKYNPENFTETGSSERWKKHVRQEKPSPVEAAEYLIDKQSGYVENAFYSVKLGKEVGLCWGFYDEKRDVGYGLAKIIKKHIEKYKDFDSVEKAMNVIDGLLKNPTLKLKLNTKTKNYNISDGRYLVAFNADSGVKNFIITAYKSGVKTKDKKK